MATLQSERLFEIQAELGEFQEVGATPRGSRLIASVAGGMFSGPKLRGEVLTGGGDWLLIRADGIRELDVRITLRTDDGHLIYMSYRGMNSITPDIVQRLMDGETVDPSEYYFRITPVFETGAEQYGWLNSIVAVGVGERLPTAVRYVVYQIL